MAATTLELEITKRHNETVLAGLEEGDMIECPRGVYSHWAIYIGNKEVVHLTGDEDHQGFGWVRLDHILTICGRHFWKGEVKRDNFWTVVGGCRAQKNNDKDSDISRLPTRKIVKKAKSMVGEPVYYNALYNNCEHFASWCRYGVRHSDQADDLVGAVLARAIIPLLALLGLLSYLPGVRTDRRAHRREDYEREMD